MNESNTNTQEVRAITANTHTLRDFQLALVGTSLVVNMYFFITWLVITYGADMRVVITQ